MGWRGFYPNTAAVQYVAVLLHDNSIGTRRDRRPGEDACCSAALQGLSAGARRDPLGYGQFCTRLGHVAAKHGVAVHRTVVLRWNLQVRDDVLYQHPAIGVKRGYQLSFGQWLGLGKQLWQRFVQRL